MGLGSMGSLTKKGEKKEDAGKVHTEATLNPAASQRREYRSDVDGGRFTGTFEDWLANRAASTKRVVGRAAKKATKASDATDTTTTGTPTTDE